jgi:hypothetical protein
VADEQPTTDDRDPADVVSGMVDHVLRLVDTWPAEAHSRLERLAQVWRLRLRSLDGERSTGARATPGRSGRSLSTSRSRPTTPTPSATCGLPDG